MMLSRKLSYPLTLTLAATLALASACRDDDGVALSANYVLEQPTRVDIEAGFIGAVFGTSYPYRRVAPSITSPDGRFVYVRRPGRFFVFEVTEEGVVPRGDTSVSLTVQGFNIPDMEWYNGHVLVVMAVGAVLMNVDDPDNPYEVGSFRMLEAFDNPDSDLQATAGRSCLMEGHYLVYTLGLAVGAEYGGAEIVDLDKVDWEARATTAVEAHLENPWFTPTDCVVKGRHAYFTDPYTESFGAISTAGFWPLHAPLYTDVVTPDTVRNIMFALRAALAQVDEGSTSSDAFSPIVHADTFTEGAADDVKDGVLELGIGASSFGAELYFAADPPGPFLMDQSWLAAIETGASTVEGLPPLRGNNAVYVDISQPEAVELIRGVVDAFYDPNASALDVLKIALVDLAPYTCWWNPSEIEPAVPRPTFDDGSAECAIVLPEGAVHGLIDASSSVASLEPVAAGLLEYLNELYVENDVVPVDRVADVAAHLARYQRQALENRLFIAARTAAKNPGTFHHVDLSDMSALGKFYVRPRTDQRAEFRADSMEVLATVLETDLEVFRSGGTPTTEVSRLFTGSKVDTSMPVDFGPDYQYPNNPGDELYYPDGVRGQPARMWGTEGMKIESKVLGKPTEFATDVPGSPYWIATSEDSGWDIMSSENNEIANVLHIGDPLETLQSVSDVGISLPVRLDPNRFKRNLEDGFTGAIGFDALGLDHKTILLADASGEFFVLDIENVGAGQDPKVLFRATLGDGVRILGMASPPGDSSAILFGAIVEEFAGTGAGAVAGYNVGVTRAWKLTRVSE